MMKNKFTIFFAIPFDSLTRTAYETLQEKLRKHYELAGKSLMLITGNKVIGPSEIYSKIISFKRQNEDLHKQFMEDITKAHVVVADLTNANSNVHFELGMALAMNKNILRVTGRSLESLSFDTRNLDTREYKDFDDLFEKIKSYLDVFFLIKDLRYGEEHGDLYREHGVFKLPGTPQEIQRGQFWLTTGPLAVFRDGAIQLRAKFMDAQHDNAGLGVVFRRSAIGVGYFLKFCKGGHVQLVSFPEHKMIQDRLTSEDFERTFHALIDLQNDEMEVKVNDTPLTFSNLELQQVGGVYLASFESQAEFEKTQTLNRDTI